MKKIFLVLIALVAFSSSANAKILAYYARTITIMVDTNNNNDGILMMVLVGKDFRLNQYKTLYMHERQYDSGHCYVWAGNSTGNPRGNNNNDYTMVGELCGAEGVPTIYTEKLFDGKGNMVKTTTTKMNAAN